MTVFKDSFCIISNLEIKFSMSRMEQFKLMVI